MDLTDQVRNHYATVRHTKPTVPELKTENKNQDAHARALQYLSNGVEGIPYSETLRIVEVAGDKQPLMAARVTQKHPGYTRNQIGAPFTS
mmetsp:Transcript_73369/g.148460  ORF Transcript_73369/g.148460 Transcript_73369/m.148460 type:complete len:90 (+) Transcript_73369:103-372(+)